MILIPHFRDFVEQELADRHPIQRVFMHFLFPSSFPEDPRLAAVLGGRREYQRVSILGFLVAGGDGGKGAVFRSELGWLMGSIWWDSDLMQDPVALLGLAVGLRCEKDDPLCLWFTQSLLPKAVGKGLDPSFSSFLDCLVWQKAFVPAVGQGGELHLFASLYGSNSVPAKAVSDDLQAYFIRFRKEDFPAYREDYFRSILSVWIVDQVLALCPCGEEADRVWRAKLHGPIELVVSRKASVRARSLAVAIMVSVAGLLVLGGYWFFLRLLNVGENQALYDRADLATEWVGGIAAVSAALIRLLYFLFTGKSWKWEVEKIYAFAYPRFLGRLRRTFGLEVKGQ